MALEASRLATKTSHQRSWTTHVERNQASPRRKSWKLAKSAREAETYAESCSAAAINMAQSTPKAEKAKRCKSVYPKTARAVTTAMCGSRNPLKIASHRYTGVA